MWIKATVAETGPNLDHPPPCNLGARSAVPAWPRGTRGKHNEPHVIHTHSPEDILAEGWEGMLLVVPKHLKYNRLALDVFDEGLGHLHSNLRERKST